MICPSCSDDVTPVATTVAPPLAICPNCERSIVLTDGGARLAIASDTAHLTSDQRRNLNAARTETAAARRAKAQR